MTTTDKQVAASVWGAWLSLEDVPLRTNAEVLEAVRATRTADATHYEHMSAALRALGWGRK